MTSVLIGGSLLTVSLAVLAAALWFWWLAGHGRHRKQRRPGPLLWTPAGVSGDGPYGTEAVLLEVPPAPSVLPLQVAEVQEEAGAADPETVALRLDVDRADFADCPKEARRTPHFLHNDGSRTCCHCETTTAGDVT